MQTLKSLLVTALVLAAVFLGYDYFLAPPEEKVVFKTTPTGPPASTAAPVVVSDTAPADAPAAPSPAPVAPPADAPLAPRPLVAVPQPVAVPAAPTIPSGFVPPVLPTIDEATKGWTQIPATAFPRQVKLLRPATFSGAYGQTQMQAGAEVSAVGFAAGLVTIAPAPGSPMRATLPLDHTDLRILLTTAYARWRETRVADARLAWERRQKAPAPAAAPSLPSAADGRPQASADGTYALLLASMKSGMVTEVTPNSITRWGRPEEGSHNGKRCWEIPVDYDASTMFGKFSTTAVAKVVDGRVAGWFYKGSGEPVP